VGKRKKRDGWAEEVAAARGLDVEIIPDQEYPRISPETEFYMIAVSHLITCRQFGMAAGPVPWTAVHAYCREIGYDNWEKMMTIVTLVVQALDQEDEKNANAV